VGQDKRNTVACEVVHWVEVVKDRGQRGREWRVHDNVSYILQNCQKFNKSGSPATRLSSALGLAKGHYSAQHCSLTQRRPELAIW